MWTVNKAVARLLIYTISCSESKTRTLSKEKKSGKIGGGGECRGLLQLSSTFFLFLVCCIEICNWFYFNLIVYL